MNCKRNRTFGIKSGDLKPQLNDTFCGRRAALFYINPRRYPDLTPHRPPCVCNGGGFTLTITVMTAVIVIPFALLYLKYTTILRMRIRSLVHLSNIWRTIFGRGWCYRQYNYLGSLFGNQSTLSMGSSLIDRVFGPSNCVRNIQGRHLIPLVRTVDYFPLLSAKMSCQTVAKLVTFPLRGYEFGVRKCFTILSIAVHTIFAHDQSSE